MFLVHSLHWGWYKIRVITAGGWNMATNHRQNLVWQLDFIVILFKYKLSDWKALPLVLQKQYEAEAEINEAFWVVFVFP